MPSTRLALSSSQPSSLTAQSFLTIAPGLTSLRDVSQVTFTLQWSTNLPALSVCLSTSRLSMLSPRSSQSTTVSTESPWTRTLRLLSSLRPRSAPRSISTPSSSACPMSAGLRCKPSMVRLGDGKKMRILGRLIGFTFLVILPRRTRQCKRSELVVRLLAPVPTSSSWTTLLRLQTRMSGRSNSSGSRET